jgi:hypothetical protein
LRRELAGREVRDLLDYGPALRAGDMEMRLHAGDDGKPALLLSNGELQEVLALAIDPNSFLAARRRSRLKVLVCSARPDERSLKMLARVMAEVRRRDPEAVFLSLGETLSDMSRLDELYAELSLDEFDALLTSVTAAIELPGGEGAIETAVAAQLGIPCVVPQTSPWRYASLRTLPEESPEFFAQALLDAPRERGTLDTEAWEALRQRVVRGATG